MASLNPEPEILPPHRGEAVLTGSHVYGIPHSESDVDLVVLADPETQRHLARLLSEDGTVRVVSGPAGGTSLRAGKLNLILTSSADEIERWRNGTSDLVALKPVTREHAVAYLKVVVDGNVKALLPPREEKNDA